ncbi:MAG TPA: cytochrome c-type biogenesis protein [Pyrinomonadaceae bacterium]|nr:cytochrome c-type biogenesis protein [Pyrinomonadaceae bacterium]
MKRALERGRLARMLQRGRSRTVRASRPRSVLLLFLLLVFVVPAALAQVRRPEPVKGDAALEERLHKLSQELRCLVCQNETLADSRADLAEDLRDEIREQMKAGKSDKEIIAFLTDRYGQFILYKPQVTPTTYLLWFGPFLLLLAGLAVLFYYIKQRRDLIAEQPLTSDERKRAEEMLRSVSGKETA